MKPKSQADTFGSYIDIFQKHMADQEKEKSLGGNPFDLLMLLAESHPKPVQELFSASRMGFADFADALKTLTKLEMITMSGPAGQELVDLTPTGERLIHAAE